MTLSPTPDAADRITANGLTRLARELRSEVAKLEDMGSPISSASSRGDAAIAPDPERLSLYGITLQQLAGKVEGANRSFQAGQVREGGEQSAVLAGETLQTPEASATC